MPMPRRYHCVNPSYPYDVIEPFSRDKKTSPITDSLPTGCSKRFAIFCFGKLRIYVDHTPLFLTNRKSEELLALLACERGAFLSKNDLAQSLWPDVNLPHAVDRLYKCLRSLRGTKATLDIPILSVSGRLALDMTQTYCDLEEFEQLCQTNDLSNLERALFLYKGSLFFASDYDWAIDKESYYDIRYLEITERLSRYYEDRNPPLSHAYRQNFE